MGDFRKQFRAPWDVLLVTITSILVTLLLGLSFYNQDTLLTIISSAVIIGASLFGIYGYSIHDRTLRILRLGWSKDIHLKDIERVEYRPDAMLGSIRVWGIGGLLGYIGHFRNRVLGKYKAYATHRRKTVVITTTDQRQIVVSPDAPEVFVRSMQAAIRSSMASSLETDKAH